MYSNMQANILPSHTLKSWMGSSECIHVAYQMNRDICHAHTMVIYTIDGMGMWERFS